MFKAFPCNIENIKSFSLEVNMIDSRHVNEDNKFPLSVQVIDKEIDDLWE